jgi:hypothetical protein
MLTRQQIKSCIIKVHKSPTYAMFFDIIQDDNEYYFNIMHFSAEEIKELVPVKILTRRKAKNLFKDKYYINDMGDYKDEKTIINNYFPAIMYEHKCLKQNCFVFADCYEFLVNKNLLKPIPVIKVNT